MPKKIAGREYERILHIIGKRPDGIGLDGLLSDKSVRLEKRTLQRRLAMLLQAGRIVAEGGGRSLRYKVAGASALSGPSSLGIHAGMINVPLTREAGDIREYVGQPKENRVPVGYQPEFLEQYVPNETEYLPADLRKQLAVIGAGTGEERPAGTFARDIMNRLLIDLSWASSKLEGNTYSLLETERLIALGEVASGKDALETQMILNHKAAIELLVEEANTIGFNRYTILNLHAILSDGLLPNPEDCGRLRCAPVAIKGSVYAPITLPQKLDEAFALLLDKASAIRDPFEQAFFAMVHLAYLQPFMDVNKRVSRLAANIPLIRKNLSPLAFIDLPEELYIQGILGVYEMNRVELLRDVFVWSYERSCQHYLAITQNLVPPDPLRMKYRKEMAEVVRGAVNAMKSADEDLSALVPATVENADITPFTQLIKQELMRLHEGSIARFRIAPLAFRQWKKAETAEP